MICTLSCHHHIRIALVTQEVIAGIGLDTGRVDHIKTVSKRNIPRPRHPVAGVFCPMYWSPGSSGHYSVEIEWSQLFFAFFAFLSASVVGVIVIGTFPRGTVE